MAAQWRLVTDPSPEALMAVQAVALFLTRWGWKGRWYDPISLEIMGEKWLLPMRRGLSSVETSPAQHSLTIDTLDQQSVIVEGHHIDRLFPHTPR